MQINVQVMFIVKEIELAVMLDGAKERVDASRNLDRVVNLMRLKTFWGLTNVRRIDIVLVTDSAVQQVGAMVKVDATLLLKRKRITA